MKHLISLKSILIALAIFLLVLSSTSCNSDEDNFKGSYGQELKHPFINYATITKDSVERYERLAANGDAEAMFMLANCYARGLCCEQDSIKAISLLRKSAVAGDYDAQMRMCEMYSNRLFPFEIWDEQFRVKDYIPENIEQTEDLADRGEAWAQVLMGWHYSLEAFDDIPNGRRYARKAREYFIEAAKQGFAWGQYELATRYDGDEKIKEIVVNYGGEFQLLENAAASQGCRSALINMSYCNDELLAKYFPILDIDTVKHFKVDADSIDVYQSHANDGDADAEFKLGVCYYDGIGIDKDKEKALNLIHSSANKGNARACNTFGNLLMNVLMNGSLFYYYEAAKQGNAWAIASIGHRIINSRANNKIQIAKYFYHEAFARDSTDLWILNTIGGNMFDNHQESDAFFYLSKAKELGTKDARILYRLARCYFEGLGVRKNYTKALELFHEADIPASKMYIGLCYENGTGVEPDMATALEYYRKGADANDIECIYRLGLCYEYGRGVQQDIGKAVEYYKLIVSIGSGKNIRYPNTAMRLADCYANGKGVPVDTIEANRWYSKAAEQGNEYAKVLTSEDPAEYEAEYEKEKMLRVSAWDAFFKGIENLFYTPRDLSWDKAKAFFSVWFKKVNIFVLLALIVLACCLFVLACCLLWLLARWVYHIFNPHHSLVGETLYMVREDDDYETWFFSDKSQVIITDKEGSITKHNYRLEKNNMLRIEQYRNNEIVLIVVDGKWKETHESKRATIANTHCYITDELCKCHKTIEGKIKEKKIVMRAVKREELNNFFFAKRKWLVGLLIVAVVIALYHMTSIYNYLTEYIPEYFVGIVMGIVVTIVGGLSRLIIWLVEWKSRIENRARYGRAREEHRKLNSEENRKLKAKENEAEIEKPSDEPTSNENSNDEPNEDVTTHSVNSDKEEPVSDDELCDE